MTKRSPRETRIKLLDATVAVILTDGATRLTLDAVAAQAGVSKGGLLHHFPTKEQLVRGLLDYVEQSWEQRFTHALQGESEGTPGRWCRAYIRASLDLSVDEEHQVRALSVAMNAFPEYFAGIDIKMWPPADDDGLLPGRALVIQSACDGLWLSDFMRVAPLTPDKRSKIRADLRRLAA